VTPFENFPDSKISALSMCPYAVLRPGILSPTDFDYMAVMLIVVGLLCVAELAASLRAPTAAWEATNVDP
jgi:hypothetical protein